MQMRKGMVLVILEPTVLMEEGMEHRSPVACGTWPPQWVSLPLHIAGIC